MTLRRFVPSFAPVLAIAAATLLTAMPADAQTDAAALWEQLKNPVFSAAGSGAVQDVRIQRDVIDLTFESGQMALADAVSAGSGGEGRVFAAAFKGRGRLRFVPTLPIEFSNWNSTANRLN